MKKSILGFLIATLGLVMVIFIYYLKKRSTVSILDKPYDAIVERDKKGEEFDEPAKFLELYEKLRSGESNEKYPAGYSFKELRSAKSRKASLRISEDTLDWVERGPGNVSGRTTAIFIDPTDFAKRRWYAASEGGGIWKTIDRGETWEHLTGDLPNLSTSAIGMSASDIDVIYAGTGNGWFGTHSINGSGIWKTIDGGTSWESLESTLESEDFRNVNSILVDPENTDLVFAATNMSAFYKYDVEEERVSFLWRSDNGGNTWNNVLTREIENNGAGRIQQIIANTNNFDTLYTTINGDGIYRSIDRGLTWEKSSNSIPSNKIQRVELAISQKNPRTIYASAETDRDLSALYVTYDAGDNWIQLVEEDIVEPDWLNGQGWFANAIGVDPYNEDTVFIGGLDIYKVAVVPNSEANTKSITSIDTVGLDNYLEFISFSSANLIDKGVTVLVGDRDGDGNINDIQRDDFVSTEIRFGSNLRQMAHRFTVPEGRSSGVAPEDYSYADYVEVPFQVWDLENDRQLMVSFRDQENNGEFNLNDGTEDEALSRSREYLFIHALPYSDTPNEEITKDAGYTYQQMFFMWPVMAEGISFNPDREAKITINAELVASKLKSTEKLSDWRGSDDGFPYVHADHHSLAIIPENEATHSYSIVNSSDGGVAISRDKGKTWQTKYIGMQNTQFYGIAKRPKKNEYIGGMQDNGTWRSPENQESTASSLYSPEVGGDGFEAIWNYRDDRKILATTQFNGIYRSINTGQSYSLISDVSDGGGGIFFTKLDNVPSHSDLVFAVSRTGIWKSEDFGASWNETKITNNMWPGFFVYPDVTISLQDPSIVWAGAGLSNTTGTFISKNQGENFVLVNEFDKDNSLAPSTSIQTHPYLPETAFLTFGIFGKSKILRTDNSGESWYDITGFADSPTGTSSNGFPDVAVFSMLVMPNDTSTIWAGTEIGLFESKDSGRSWYYADNGLEAVSIWQMKIFEDQVVLGTHGRGIWSVTLPELNNVPFVSHAEYNSGNIINVSIENRSRYDKLELYVQGELVSTIDSPQEGVQVYPVSFRDAGNQNIYAVSTVVDKEYKSNSFNVLVDQQITGLFDQLFSSTNAEKFKIYPNPSEGVSKFQLPQSFLGKDYELTVHDLSGKLVLSDQNKVLRENSISFGNLNRGLYVVRVNIDGKVFASKLSVK